jgi:Secretion system C-terminal sorting domain
MKKIHLLWIAFLCLCFASQAVHAQWNTVLATEDDTPNGTGHQTVSVAVVSSKCFVALVNHPIVKTWSSDLNFKDSCVANYLVGYINPTSDQTGRVDAVPYGSTATAGYFSKWVSGFDELPLYRAYKAVGTSDSLIYVANNDPDHNIVVFKITGAGTVSTDFRMKTGTGDIQGLAVDNNGYVYVAEVNATAADTKEIKIFKGIKASGTKWGTTYDDTPIATIDLPLGTYRGLAVSGDGKQLFVSNMGDRTIIKYTGTPATGYTKNTGFAWTESKNDTIPRTKYDTLGTSAWDIGRPLGLAYLNGNNLIYVATARLFGNTIFTHANTSGYEFSKIIGINPTTGKPVDSIDVAKYYFINSDVTGVSQSYTKQVFGPDVHISGYASAYDVGFDEKKNLYSQSMYSWTVDKWQYTGTLPTVPLTSVSRQNGTVPTAYELSSNYPNPFNPSTRFQFSISDAQFVSVKVFDILGHEVAALVNGTMSAGKYSVEWNAANVPSGIYFCRMQAGSFTSVKKMTLMK